MSRRDRQEKRLVNQLQDAALLVRSFTLIANREAEATRVGDHAFPDAAVSLHAHLDGLRECPKFGMGHVRTDFTNAGIPVKLVGALRVSLSRPEMGGC